MAQERTWKPSVTVASILERDGRFLVVEEETPEGLRFNQPAGHLEAGESLIQAAARETLEETGNKFAPGWLVGVYEWTRPQGDVTYLRFAFGGEWLGEVPNAQLDAGIVRAVWMTREELQATVDRHRSPLVLQCVDDWIAGHRADLNLLRYYA